MSWANSSVSVFSTLEYFSALPGKIAMDIRAPMATSATTATGTKDRMRKVFALPSFFVTSLVPVWYCLERIQKTRNSGSRITMKTKPQKSVE